MFPASAYNPGCLILLALECEFVVYQIGTMRVDNAWSHQSEGGKFLVAKGEYGELLVAETEHSLLPWFMLMSKILSLRFNYSHCHQREQQCLQRSVRQRVVFIQRAKSPHDILKTHEISVILGLKRMEGCWHRLRGGKESA